jgi:hypothetical protein
MEMQSGDDEEHQLSNEHWKLGVQHHSIEKLKAQLLSWERMPCRDQAERNERDARVEEIKRDIRLIESGQLHLGNRP